jgi:hypothetical protein
LIGWASLLGSPRSGARHAGWLGSAGALATTAALIGCTGGGAAGPNVVTGEGFAFRHGEIPARWQPIDVSDAALSFRDDDHAGTVVVNARCDRDGEDVPLQSLTQHLFLRFTDRELQVEEVVPFDGREALHTVLTAKLDGVPKSFSVWVMKKDGCVYDLVYIADPRSFTGGAAAFDAFAKEFHALPREGDEGP